MSGLPRDRDDQGRPRNARPRDATGRPLAHDEAGVPPVPDLPHRTREEALREAQLLIDGSRPFGAHEVFEAMWKQATEPDERALWRGLAQLMVGLTHQKRGNPVGATSLLDRGIESLHEVGNPAAAAVDVAAWTAWAHLAVGAVTDGVGPPPPPRLPVVQR